MLLIFLIFKQFICLNQINGRDYCVPGGSLDTKMGHIDLCHILMSYASYDIKYHIMMNDAYEIEI